MPAAFTVKRIVQFSETDLAGVMHFSNYFRWIEDCEHAFWRSIGLSVTHDGEMQSFSWPRVSVACEYNAPLRFEDEAELHLRVNRVGVKSIEWEVRFTRDGTQTAVGRCTAACCTIDGPGGFRAIEIPEFVREKLAPYMRESR